MKELGIKKLYYSISEVSKITGLEQYVLRYWENEFEELRPAKNRAGNRIYTNKDIQVILKIKKLLKDEKYTIEGAKKLLKEPEELKAKLNETADEDSEEIKDSDLQDNNKSLKKDLEQIKNFLIYLQSKL
ncbi:MAG: MerR family transcriptional regulator [Syntrophothermus sp.]